MAQIYAKGSHSVLPVTVLGMAKRGKKKAEKFISKDHGDSNMLVAIRIRPLSIREMSMQDYDIVRAEDKLLVKIEKMIMNSIGCVGQVRSGV